MHLVACESGTVTLTCPGGYISNVVTVYGRIRQDICLAPPGLVIDNCGAVANSDGPNNICHGQAYCSFLVTADLVIVAPCPYDTYEYAEISWDCVTPSINTDLAEYLYSLLRQIYSIQVYLYELVTGIFSLSGSFVDVFHEWFMNFSRACCTHYSGHYW